MSRFNDSRIKSADELADIRRRRAVGLVPAKYLHVRNRILTITVLGTREVKSIAEAHGTTYAVGNNAAKRAARAAKKAA